MADSADTVFPFGKTDAASTATLEIFDALISSLPFLAGAISGKFQSIADAISTGMQ